MKDGLLHCKTRPFAMRKAVFCKTSGNVLNIKTLRLALKAGLFQHYDAALHVGKTEHVDSHFHKIVARKALALSLQ